MASILVFGFPAHGHVYPTLPVVAELGERGHRVVYYTSERFFDDVSDAGAEARLDVDPFLAGRSRIDAPNFTAEAPALLFEATLSVLDNESPRVRDEGFDAVMFDSVAPRWTFPSIGWTMPSRPFTCHLGPRLSMTWSSTATRSRRTPVAATCRRCCRSVESIPPISARSRRPSSSGRSSRRSNCSHTLTCSSRAAA